MDAEGFEPTAFRVQVERSTELIYAPLTARKLIGLFKKKSVYLVPFCFLPRTNCLKSVPLTLVTRHLIPGMSPFAPL